MRAIELYKKNLKVSEICTTLNRSRNWFYKWLRRYNTNDPQWYKEQSRAPKTKKNKTSSETETLILQTRKHLRSQPVGVIYYIRRILYTKTHNKITLSYTIIKSYLIIPFL